MLKAMIKATQPKARPAMAKFFPEIFPVRLLFFIFRKLTNPNTKARVIKIQPARGTQPNNRDIIPEINEATAYAFALLSAIDASYLLTIYILRCYGTVHFLSDGKI